MQSHQIAKTSFENHDITTNAQISDPYLLKAVSSLNPHTDETCAQIYQYN